MSIPDVVDQVLAYDDGQPTLAYEIVCMMILRGNLNVPSRILAEELTLLKISNEGKLIEQLSPIQ